MGLQGGMSDGTVGTMTTFWKSGQLTICFLASILTISHARANPEEIEERCRKESNVPQSDIENYRNLELPQTREGKCYGACVMKAVNMMNSKGKIDEKVSEELASRYIDDVNQLKTVDSKVQSCARRANMGKDMCETAYQFMKCAERHSRSKSTRGISIPLPEISLTIPPVTLVLLQLANLGSDECLTAYSYNKCLMRASSSRRKEKTISVTLPEITISLSPPPLSFTLLSLSLLG